MNIAKLKNIFPFILIFFLNFSAWSQEKLTGMSENPIIKKYFVEKNTNIEKSLKNMAVKLPFKDDFSSYYAYPTQKLWADSFVFINDGFGKNNISIGCATFDAFDHEGKMYLGASTFPFIADYLTSQSIRLDSVFTGVPRSATPADSVYLSFFYQPQGYGDKPETGDSLVLQLFNPVSNTWNTVWSAPGMSYNDFIIAHGVSYKPVMIPITDPDYFSSQFKFRFYNIVSLANNAFPTWAGNVDHWNIDYVYLDFDRNINEEYPIDLAFKTRTKTLLKNYRYMPWSHFLVNPTSQMVSQIQIPYKNYSSVLLNVTENIIITDLSGTTPVFNSGISASNLPAFTDTVFLRSPVPYTFNSGVAENADFLVQFIINTMTIPDLIRSNDTVSFYQKFYNYFSYDDSSPEAAYALVGNNAQLAYMFNLSHPDTLTAVQIQFNRVLNNVNEDKYFKLRVWNEQNGKPHQIIYEQQGLKPIVEGLFGFHNYILDEPLPVSGNIFVGWQQQESEALNIGFDRNNNRNSKIFYNIGSGWIQSMYEGALMMRIIVGSETQPYVNINDTFENEQDWALFPNPASANEQIQITGISQFNHSVSIYSAAGKLVHNQDLFTNSIQFRAEAGLYVVVLIHNETGTLSTKKLMITR
jgi:hypothetical protein